LIDEKGPGMPRAPALTTALSSREAGGHAVVAEIATLLCSSTNALA